MSPYGSLGFFLGRESSGSEEERRREEEPNPWESVDSSGFYTVDTDRKSGERLESFHSQIPTVGGEV